MQWKCYFTNRYKVAILIELHCSGKKRLYRRVVLACVCVSVSGVCVCVAIAERGRRIGPTEGYHRRSVTRTGSVGQVDVFHRSFNAVGTFPPFCVLPSHSTFSSLSLSFSLSLSLHWRTETGAVMIGLSWACVYTCTVCVFQITW